MKKVSSSTIKKYVSKVKTGILNLNIENGEIEVEVKYSLPLSERIGFVKNVCEGVTADGFYHPEMLDFFFGLSVIDYFTNINLPEVKSEDYMTDKNLQYDLIMNTDLVDKIKSFINQNNYNFLSKLQAECDKKINDIVHPVNKLVNLFAETFKEISGMSDVLKESTINNIVNSKINENSVENVQIEDLDGEKNESE